MSRIEGPARLLAAALAVALLAPAVADAQEVRAAAETRPAVFMKLGDIKGETTDKAFEDQIDVVSWAWGTTQSGVSAMDGPRPGPGTATFEMRAGPATRALFRAHEARSHISEATLTVRKAGGGQDEKYLKIKMTDVLVTSISTGGDTARGTLAYRGWREVR